MPVEVIPNLTFFFFFSPTPLEEENKVYPSVSLYVYQQTTEQYSGFFNTLQVPNNEYIIATNQIIQCLEDSLLS